MNLASCPRALLLIPLALACFALAPTASAVMPPPDGGYGDQNTAEGDNALFNLDTSQGSNNTAIGYSALYSNTTASNNTAIGVAALTLNTIGTSNTASGYFALSSNTTGNNNTATGFQALQNNTTGTSNTANGDSALYSNTTGNSNTANGADALQDNGTGSSNTANGSGALLKNTTGSGNIALGAGAGVNLTTGSNNIDIGNAGVARESKTIRIGTAGTQTNTYIAGINVVTVASGLGVIVDSNGHLGTMTSSARFKEAIKPMEKVSEAILALKPVTFRYKHDLDPDGIPQFGLVAEDVEKVNPDLVARDEQGKPYTVRYEAVNAMLLNEFLKEHRGVQEQKATIEEFKKEIADLTAMVKEQSAQLQKVSAQLELSKSAPQTVLNDQ